jgi:hypothetical protein
MRGVNDRIIQATSRDCGVAGGHARLHVRRQRIEGSGGRLALAGPVPEQGRRAWPGRGEFGVVDRAAKHLEDGQEKAEEEEKQERRHEREGLHPTPAPGAGEVARQLVPPTG